MLTLSPQPKGPSLHKDIWHHKQRHSSLWSQISKPVTTPNEQSGWWHGHFNLHKGVCGYAWFTKNTYCSRTLKLVICKPIYPGYISNITLHILQLYYSPMVGEGRGPGLRKSVSVPISLQHHLEIASHWRSLQRQPKALVNAVKLYPE